MALEQKLSVRMSQRLVMTPSLQQAIKLLQMSKLELVEEVQQELLENPVLEESAEAPANETPESEPADADAPDPLEDFDFESYFDDVEGFIPRSSPESGSDMPTFENTLSEPVGLSDRLIWQLDLSTSDQKIKDIGRAVIGNINDDGYLRASLDEIERMGPYERGSVEEALRLVQTFDPAGIAARDLVECLCLQLVQRGEDGTIAETIVRLHMDRLQSRKYKELAEILGIGMGELQAEIELIQSLDPRPGRKYSVDNNSTVVPDVHVVKIDDDYHIMLNEEGLPRLRISPVYRRMVARGMEGHSEPDAREYVRNKLRAAFRLIKSLEERQRTIFKVATSIVKFQREFLDHGVERLKPLVLKDVAEDIGMHESTVSRVVNQKYMHTHRGVFELRFFFHSGITSTDGGDNVSSLAVKDRIKKIIADEQAARPLSDAEIVKLLRIEGLQIARRTVAKYREELRIPSSSSRRQAFT